MGVEGSGFKAHTVPIRTRTHSDACCICTEQHTLFGSPPSLVKKNMFGKTTSTTLHLHQKSTSGAWPLQVMPKEPHRGAHRCNRAPFALASSCDTAHTCSKRSNQASPSCRTVRQIEVPEKTNMTCKQSPLPAIFRCQHAIQNPRPRPAITRNRRRQGC